MRYSKSWLFHSLIIGAGMCFGLGIGMGLYTFYYAKGASYLTNNAKSCANCHVMQTQYDAWQKGSHHAVATCNDCHSPKSFLPKYFSKAVNGFFHGYAFSTGDFHEPIQMKAHNKIITEQSCRRCHGEFVHGIDNNLGADHIACIRCHNTVGHFTK